MFFSLQILARTKRRCFATSTPLAFFATSARSPERVETDASVTPRSSEITWAYVCLLLRNTHTLGRASVPSTFFRTLACRRILPVYLWFVAILSLDLILPLSRPPCRLCGG